MIWLMVLVGLALAGCGLLMAMGQLPSIGGPGMAWVLLFIGLLILVVAYATWVQMI